MTNLVQQFVNLFVQLRIADITALFVPLAGLLRLLLLCYCYCR
jgi:hypothetical protein